MKQRIELSELPPGLNGSDGLINEHYRKKKERQDRYVWLIRSKKPRKHKGRVVVNYTRRSVRKMDLDNVASSFKHLGDALEKCGVIKDDSPDILTELNVKWEKAPSRKEQATIIEIEDVE